MNWESFKFAAIGAAQTLAQGWSYKALIAAMLAMILHKHAILFYSFAFLVFISAGFSCTGETRLGKACAGKAVLGQKAPKAGNLGRYMAGRASVLTLCERAQTEAFLAATGAVCGSAAE